MQGSQEGKRAKLWGPRVHFGANMLMKIVGFNVIEKGSECIEVLY